MRYLVLIAFAWPPDLLVVGEYITITPEAAAPFLAAGLIKPA